jgi:hypothetical protein
MVSVRRVAPVLLLVIATTAFAQKQSSQPPRNLHRVGDHWTAYNPPDPSTYPAGAKTHQIKAGDTLWALAQQYFGNPYLWPQLWESNTWVTDAHWIYPGDTLLIDSEAIAQVEQPGSDTEEVATAEPAGEAPLARIVPEKRPIPLGTESDIYCYGYIGAVDEPLPNYISSHEDVEIKYVPRMDPVVPASASAGDLVYVEGGTTTGLVAGETYLVVVPGEIVKHPATGEPVGQAYDYVGQIKILCAEATQSRAIITQACREFTTGARLKPMPQLPIPIARVPEVAGWCDAPSGRTSGYIVDSKGWDLGLVEGNLVQIDLGSQDQVSPGDFLTVFRPSTLAGQPRVVLGQIGILTTEAGTATAIVLDARREIVVGDQVELR